MQSIAFSYYILGCFLLSQINQQQQLVIHAMPLPLPPASHPPTLWLDPVSREWRPIGNYETVFANHFLLPQDFDRAEQWPVARPTPQQLDAIQNSALFEGDIMGMVEGNLDDMHWSGTKRAKRSGNAVEFDSLFRVPFHSSLNTGTYPDKLWSNGRVPYMLEDGMTESQRVAIAQAFDEYKQKTCIRFVPRELDDDDYIYVTRNTAFGCSSFVGRAGGNQSVSLEVGKCFSKGIIAHELMHALGFFHEHSRTDRDRYVFIEEENVRPGMLRNFDKYPRKIIDPLEMPYDYDSVMHYHKLAFTRNGRATILPRNSSAEIGQRFKLSDVDAMKVNKLYQCEDAGDSRELIPISTSTTTPYETSSASTTPLVTEPPEESEEEEEEGEDGDSVEEEDNKKISDNQERLRALLRARSTHSSTPTTKKSLTTTTANPIQSTTADSWPMAIKNMITISIFTFGTKSTTARPRHTAITASQKRRTKWITTPAPATITIEAITASSTLPPERQSTNYKSLKRVKGKIVGEVEERCKDLNPHCEMWARLGHCEQSVKYMSHYCRRSCRVCHVIGGGGVEETTGVKSTTTEPSVEDKRVVPSCSDKNLFCGYWAKIGECRSGSRFMRIFCRRSCNNCH